ncbi:hypothetical protein [Serratia liquefaciens]|uniref:hypothetical protein n=1 Tax=Serratia liquefaciens TaxID=614 RepID=UPI00390689E2
MHNANQDRHEVLMAAIKSAGKASAIIRSLSFSWVELPGSEVELLMKMASGYADDATEYLINQSGKDDSEVRHA